MTRQECENLIYRSEKIGFEEAKVQVGQGVESLLKNIRNNERILLEDKF